MNDNATLTVRGDSYELPYHKGTEGEQAVDISKLRSQSGIITLDEGFGNTGSCRSKITFINGEEGILQYRGYPIQDLAELSTFTEVAYLLIDGELPTHAQHEAFKTSLSRHTLLHEDMRRFFDAFPKDAHPMAMLSSVSCALSTFYPESLDIHNEQALTIHRLLAKLPTIAAWSYRKSHGLPLMYPENSRGYVENFLRMMFGFPTEPYEADEEIVRTMDVLFMLHADHEQNCSTSTVRVVGSSHANLFASISAGIGALWGPLHGGANQAVLEMLAQIRDGGGNVSAFVDKAKDKNDPFRLMGFGHRVYKNHDPRARILKAHCDVVLKKLGVDDPLLDIAKQLEEAALKDPYFIEKRLYPNVDFYSGIIYRALKFPTDMFTVLFALGRLPGWIANWKEMIDNKMRISRPRQLYLGENKRKYIPIEKRG